MGTQRTPLGGLTQNRVLSRPCLSLLGPWHHCPILRRSQIPLAALSGNLLPILIVPKAAQEIQWPWVSSGFQCVASWLFPSRCFSVLESNQFLVIWFLKAMSDSYSQCTGISSFIAVHVPSCMTCFKRESLQSLSPSTQCPLSISLPAVPEPIDSCFSKLLFYLQKLFFKSYIRCEKKKNPLLELTFQLTWFPVVCRLCLISSFQFKCSHSKIRKTIDRLAFLLSVLISFLINS